MLAKRGKSVFVNHVEADADEDDLGAGDGFFVAGGVGDVAIAADALANGVILLTCGVRGNVIRFLPALTISNALIDEGLDILESCLERQLAG